ncbi:MAG: TetR/AcrR family transcriptional regulator [Thaumarchaeota archaeon]|nr:TetR/AcrR family transcriptional regulator [Nitrososphaerota archaeon]
MQSQRETVSPTKILEVSSRLFAEKGYANVSIRDVCKQAETTAPTIYYHFGSKRGLFIAAVSPKITIHEFIIRLMEATKSETPRRGIGSFVETYLSSFPERAFDPGLYMRDNAKLDKDSAERISAELDEIQRIAASLVQRGIEGGDFGKTDASKAADCLIGMLNHVVFQKIHFSKSRDKETAARFIKEFFFKALK